MLNDERILQKSIANHEIAGKELRLEMHLDSIHVQTDILNDALYKTLIGAASWTETVRKCNFIRVQRTQTMK